MTDRQLLQQALDALKTAEVDGNCYYEVTELLSTRLAHCDRCGKRLGGEGDIHTCSPDSIGDAQDKLIAEMAAQPEQEPVAWTTEWSKGYEAAKAETPSQALDAAYAAGYSNGMTEGYAAGIAYAAAQQEPIGYWPEERAGEYHSHDSVTAYRTPKAGWIPVYATPPAAPTVQPEQEPVGEVVEDDFSRQLVGIGKWRLLPNGAKLYTTPPAAAQREPLTDEQITQICVDLWSGGWRETAMRNFARAIEAAHGIKKKGKNNG